MARRGRYKRGLGRLLRPHVAGEGEVYDYKVAKAVLDEIEESKPPCTQLFIDLVEDGHNFHQLWAHVFAMVAEGVITGWSMSDLDTYRRAAEVEHRRQVLEGLEILIEKGLAERRLNENGEVVTRLTEEGRRVAEREFGE